MGRGRAYYIFDLTVLVSQELIELVILSGMARLIILRESLFH